MKVFPALYRAMGASLTGVPCCSHAWSGVEMTVTAPAVVGVFMGAIQIDWYCPPFIHENAR